MLTENQVVEFVCNYLREQGYEVVRQLSTTEKGRDIVARKQESDPTELRIEAKGETSSKEQTKRFGKPFNSAQVRDHVANAFYCAATMIEPSAEEHRVRVAVALPGTNAHRKQAAAIRHAMAALGVWLFWVGPNGEIEFEASWQL